MGDEGGFAPSIQSNDEGLKLLVEAIEKAGYTGTRPFSQPASVAPYPPASYQRCAP